MTENNIPEYQKKNSFANCYIHLITIQILKFKCSKYKIFLNYYLKEVKPCSFFFFLQNIQKQFPLGGTRKAELQHHPPKGDPQCQPSTPVQEGQAAPHPSRWSPCAQLLGCEDSLMLKFPHLYSMVNLCT